MSQVGSRCSGRTRPTPARTGREALSGTPVALLDLHGSPRPPAHCNLCIGRAKPIAPQAASTSRPTRVGLLSEVSQVRILPGHTAGGTRQKGSPRGNVSQAPLPCITRARGRCAQPSDDVPNTCIPDPNDTTRQLRWPSHRRWQRPRGTSRPSVARWRRWAPPVPPRRSSPPTTPHGTGSIHRSTTDITTSAKLALPPTMPTDTSTNSAADNSRYQASTDTAMSGSSRDRKHRVRRPCEHPLCLLKSRLQREASRGPVMGTPRSRAGAPTRTQPQPTLHGADNLAERRRRLTGYLVLG